MKEHVNDMFSYDGPVKAGASGHGHESCAGQFENWRRTLSFIYGEFPFLQMEIIWHHYILLRHKVNSLQKLVSVIAWSCPILQKNRSWPTTPTFNIYAFGGNSRQQSEKYLAPDTGVSNDLVIIQVDKLPIDSKRTTGTQASLELWRDCRDDRWLIRWSRGKTRLNPAIRFRTDHSFL